MSRTKLSRPQYRWGPRPERFTRIVWSERIVFASHTDGMNAVWDNGPTAILALAQYFASLPLECRSRTIEFAFTTAHLYISRIGSMKYAR